MIPCLKKETENKLHIAPDYRSTGFSSLEGNETEQTAGSLASPEGDEDAVQFISST